MSLEHAWYWHRMWYMVLWCRGKRSDSACLALIAYGIANFCLIPRPVKRWDTAGHNLSGITSRREPRSPNISSGAMYSTRCSSSSKGKDVSDAGIWSDKNLSWKSAITTHAGEVSMHVVINRSITSRDPERRQNRWNWYNLNGRNIGT